MSINKILLLISVILFVLAGLGVDVIGNSLAFGLAFFAGSFLTA